MKLTDFVKEQAVVVPLESTDRDEVIEQLVSKLIDAGAAPKSIKDELVEQILSREKQGSTGFGRGVAVPHVKHDKVKTIAAGVGVSQTGIDFNALDKGPVHSVFLLMSPKDQPDQHLQAMEKLFSNLQNDRFRKFLRQAGTPEEVIDLLEESDAQKLTSG
jgi:mannitol/fructose-specific phosphotransferase system IIA component (Ntr-type)